ncbi:MAG TPA: F0F1 ATP synthase subunit A [Candidatus Binataceae bacterium]|nr:F0F1 ATP synthase subunit A [Candidatus Binataceae bacterium]
MNESPLHAAVVFHLGFVPISTTVVTTWGLMLVLTTCCWIATRGFQVRAGSWQAIIESLVQSIEEQIQGILGRDPGPFVPLLGTLFVFLVAANLSGIVPGVKAPTASIETPAALATIVFFSVHFYGIRIQGVVHYLKGYLEPNPVMLPLNILSEMTRSFSLAMRLFGNIMSDELVIAIILSLAGLLVPIPFMAFAILVGLVQAYIFSVLAAVYIGGGIGAIAK